MKTELYGGIQLNIKTVLWLILHILFWLVIATGALLLFFFLAKPKNSFTYDFSHADNLRCDAISVFVDTSSGLNIYFDTKDAGDDAKCYFVLRQYGWDVFSIGDMNQDESEIIVDQDYTFTNDEKIIYVLGFDPRNLENQSIQFWRSANKPYSLIASVLESNIDKIQEQNITYFTKAEDYKTLQNYIDIYDNSELSISGGTAGIFELTKFSIYECENIGGTTYQTKNIYDFNDSPKYIILPFDYTLSYQFGEDMFDNHIPIEVMFRTDSTTSNSIALRGIDDFYTSYSSGTLLRYSTATPAQYTVNAQSVQLNTTNRIVDESKMIINTLITSENTINISGKVTIVEGKGMIAGRDISPNFISWLYDSYSAIALALLTAILGGFSYSIMYIRSRKRQKKRDKEMHDYSKYHRD